LKVVKALESVIASLLQPIADDLGVDILKVSIGGGGRSQLVRVVVDCAGGIDSDRLERISRGLALQLDAEDLIKGAYRLEVTSPGLDWPLQNESDFRRYRGEWVNVLFADGSSQEGRNLGPVDGAGGNSFRLLAQGRKAANDKEIVVDMADVQKVVRAINWKEVSQRSKT